MEPTEINESPPIDTLQVNQNEDGTFTMEWDPEDPMWSWLNTMTEEDVTKIITDYVQKVLDNEQTNSIIADDSLTPE